MRVEQLAPFPFDLVMRELRRYPNAEVLWWVTVNSPTQLYCKPLIPAQHDILPGNGLAAGIARLSIAMSGSAMRISAVVFRSASVLC